MLSLLHITVLTRLVMHSVRVFDISQILFELLEKWLCLDFLTIETPLPTTSKTKKPRSPFGAEALKSVHCSVIVGAGEGRRRSTAKRLPTQPPGLALWHRKKYLGFAWTLL
jgi:hypothetical protein